jgi:O-antigen ligase
VATILVLVVAVAAILLLNATKIKPYQLLLLFLGLIVFVLAFVRTNFALGVLVLSMLLSPEFAVGQVSDRAVVVRADDLFIFIIFLGWLAKLAVYKELDLFKRTPLNVPIFLYSLACVLSTGAMLMGGEGSLRRSFFYLLKYLEYFVLYFLVVNNIGTLKEAKVFVGLLVATCFIVSAYALFFHVTTGARPAAPFEGAEQETNTLSGYLVVMMGVIFSLFLNSEDRRLKFFLAAGSAAAAVALVLTLSRSGWISFFFMFVALAVFSPRHRPFLIISLALMIALIPVLSPRSVKERAASTFESGKTYRIGRRSITIDESGAARIDSWKDAFGKLGKKPLLGYGIPATSVIDNQYTRVMIETGLAGFGAFLFLVVRLFSSAREGLAAVRESAFARSVTAGFLAGLAGLLVHSLTAASFIIIRIMEPFWFLAGIVTLLPSLAVPGAAPEMEST